MAASGFKQRQLGDIRHETSYPALRAYIASIRVAALLLASLIGLSALLTIGTVWFTKVISEPVAAQRDIGTASITTVVTLLIAGGAIAIVLIIARLFTELYELLTDVGDCLVDVATTLRRLEHSGAVRTAGPEDPTSPPQSFSIDAPTPAASAAPARVVAAPIIDPTPPPQPPVGRAPPSRADKPLAASTPSALREDDAAADNLLQLAQRHSRNGNKPEAVRCLRAIIDRYPASDSAAIAQTALSKTR
jgi:hypothetical protein